MFRSVAIDDEPKANSNSSKEPQAKEVCGSFAFGATVSFRPMTTADLEEVMAVERASYEFPWSAGFFRQELQVACARSIVAERDGKIIGYILFWMLPGAVDIHNLAVRSEYRRRGVARALMEQVIAQARHHSAARVMLEVRKSNLAAQNLYQSMGFSVTAIRKGYYSDNDEDALAMTLELAPRASQR